jgi:hypothetical protein
MPCGDCQIGSVLVGALEGWGVSEGFGNDLS